MVGLDVDVYTSKNYCASFALMSDDYWLITKSKLTRNFCVETKYCLPHWLRESTLLVAGIVFYGSNWWHLLTVEAMSNWE